ncbi:uncharacterized protein Tco025E_06704 [Trypanosoma conorhini]|uniref:Uncharacterized protein n=1 Tax=Trypanosoma conorhini TaxID=83891 RepID=A0A3S5ISG5_9TRYP|nr:uncharacterized protein Tco025E_06704 [Trypanosoma conorhini]RNF11094.1 hypothetical protein Tco025E_06704 [Trypanosoma conorhini]
MALGRLYSFGQSVLLPIGGFATGWVAYRAVEEKHLIDESYLRQLRMSNLKLQLYLQQHVFPVAFTEKYGYSEDFLKTMIERLGREGGSNEEAERWTFEQILQECDLPGQIAWLEEHVSYDIPYFYIADIFNSWCIVHRSLFTAETVDRKKETLSSRRGGNNKAFASEILCRGVVEKTLNGVFPYDVAVRALCVLAVGHTSNAKLLSQLISPSVIVERYETYLNELERRNMTSGDAISSTEVAAATLELLRALNTASVHQRWFPFWGRASTGPYPIAAQLNGEKWCACLGTLPAGTAKLCTDGALIFADILSERFNCQSGTQRLGVEGGDKGW